MKPLYIFGIMLLLTINLTYAFSINLTSSEYDLVYPNVKEVELTIIFKKSLFDNIVDINSDLTLSGSATFEDGSTKKVISIENLKDTQENKYIILLEDTKSAEWQDINIDLSGDYISNAMIGGGKKDISEKLEIKMISTDKGKVLEEKEEIQKEKEDCETRYNEYIVQCNQDKSGMQSEINDLNIKLSELQEQNDLLKTNITNLTNTKNSTSCKDENCSFLGIPFGLIIIILIIIIFNFRGKIKKLEKKPPRQHHPSFAEHRI